MASLEPLVSTVSPLEALAVLAAFEPLDSAVASFEPLDALAASEALAALEAWGAFGASAPSSQSMRASAGGAATYRAKRTIGRSESARSPQVFDAGLRGLSDREPATSAEAARFSAQLL